MQMGFKSRYTDWLIVLAWPDTQVTAAPGLYHNLFKALGLIQYDTYKAGHAALVLVDGESGKCKYFDFGRYITPNGYGRVRSYKSDPELNFIPNAKWVNGRMENLNDLLELLHKSTHLTHGNGEMFASVAKHIDGKAFEEWAEQMQQAGGQRYGPFVYRGSNCSRFVMDAVLKFGKGTFRHVWGRISLTPSPLGNTKKCASNNRVYVVNDKGISTLNAFRMNLWRLVVGRVFDQSNISPLAHDEVTAPHPEAQLLTGIGAYGYFLIRPVDGWAVYERYSGQHKDFERWVDLNLAGFDWSQPYEILHYSTAQLLRIKQGNRILEVEPMAKSPVSSLNDAVLSRGIDIENIAQFSESSKGLHSPLQQV